MTRWLQHLNVGREADRLRAEVERLHQTGITLPLVRWQLPVPPPELLTFYAGLAALATLELVDWPLAVVIAVGHEPQSQLVEGQVETNPEGYVVTQGKSTLTNLPGVFAAGDLVDHTYRQAVTAAGSGCQAALDAEWYLRDTPFPVEEALSAG